MSDEMLLTERPSVSLAVFTAAFRALAAEKSPIVVFAHARPDGDCAGTAAAVSEGIRALGYDCDWVCADEIPLRLRLLDDRADRRPESVFPSLFVRGEDGALTLTGRADRALFFAVDTAEEKLLGDEIAALLAGRFDCKLDHHPQGSSFAAVNHIDGDIGSCGEIAYRFLKALTAVTPRLATALLAAISSDTGSFKYTGATAVTHRVAAELMDRGADSDVVASKLYGSRSMRDVAALGLAYSGIRLVLDGTVGLLTVTNEQKQALGLCDEDLGEFASLPRDIRGVSVGVTIKEADGADGKYKISMRSNGADVSKMCALLGGGGHVRASGAMIEGVSSMEEAVSVVMEAVKTVLSAE